MPLGDVIALTVRTMTGPSAGSTASTPNAAAHGAESLTVANNERAVAQCVVCELSENDIDDGTGDSMAEISRLSWHTCRDGGHWACRGCWRSHVVSQIAEGKLPCHPESKHAITCCGCSAPVPPECVRDLIGERSSVALLGGMDAGKLECVLGHIVDDGFPAREIHCNVRCGANVNAPNVGDMTRLLEDYSARFFATCDPTLLACPRSKCRGIFEAPK